MRRKQDSQGGPIITTMVLSIMNVVLGAFGRTKEKQKRKAIMPVHSQTKSLTGQASASASVSDSDSTPHNHIQDHNYYVYEGERLARLLRSLQREIESVRLVDGTALPEKIWFKQQFAIGVNEVTRALERMKPQHAVTLTKPYLQAVVVASDANPRWLTKHLPSLASSRNVPLLFLRDNKHASLRLAQLFKLKTAIALGIKAKGNSINQLFAQILRGDDSVNDGTDRSLASQLLPT